MATSRPAPRPTQAAPPPPVSVYPAPSGTEDLAAQCEEAQTRIAVDARKWRNMVIGEVVLRVKVPAPTAIHVVEAAVSPHSPESVRFDMASRFLAQHVHPEDFEDLLHRWITRADTPDATAVMSALCTLGTARPFVPSRR